MGVALARGRADWVLATMLTWTQRIEEHLRNQRSKRWAREDFERVEDEYWGIETLHKSNMGIIGVTGGLGEAIAARALGFGMEVFGVARTARETSPLPGVHSPIWGMEDVEKMLPLVDVSTAAPFALCVFFRPQKKKRLHSGWS